MQKEYPTISLYESLSFFAGVGLGFLPFIGFYLSIFQNAFTGPLMFLVTLLFFGIVKCKERGLYVGGFVLGLIVCVILGFFMLVGLAGCLSVNLC